MALHCELLGIHKRHGSRVVLDNFNLQIEAGEMVALTGASGSGKSTILNIIGLLDSPEHGEVRLLGDRAPKPRTRAATQVLRHHLGYLFQNFALIDSETVASNLEIALTYSGPTPSKRERITDALAKVGLSGAEDRRVFSLSGGEQQRVALARLLLKPCDIVLADEPTGSLDAENRNIVIGLLQKLNELGKTIVIATHDDVVAATCPRVIALDNLTTMV